MKNMLEKWLLEIGEINELQNCAADVLENCMAKGEKAYYAITLINTIIERTSAIYETIDDFSLNVKE